MTAQDSVAYVIENLLDDQSIAAHCGDRITPVITSLDKSPDVTPSIVVELIDIEVKRGLQVSIPVTESVRLSIVANTYRLLTEITEEVKRVLRGDKILPFGQAETYEEKLDSYIRWLDFRVPLMR